MLSEGVWHQSINQREELEYGKLRSKAHFVGTFLKYGFNCLENGGHTA
jgi:hypothetical protein